MGSRSAPPEISLADACRILGLSEKTVRQQIKLKKIQAVKVGKSWFIDQKSVEDFASKQTARTLAAPFAEPNQAAAKPGRRGQKTLLQTEAQAGAPSARSGLTAIHDLACYRLVVAAVEQFKQPAAPAERGYVEEHCREALHQLGAGFYNFGHAKRIHYERARAALGGVIAVLSADAATSQQYERALLFCERDVLPAFGALMRKLERKGSDPHRKRGGSAQESDRVP